MRQRLAWLGGPVLVGVATVVGAAALDSYEKFVLGVWCVYALAGLGLLFPAGWAGEISVGHAGILAIAAYGAPLLATNNLVVELATGCVFGLLAGAVLGLPSLRLRGFGLAIVTLVFGEFVRVLIGTIPSLGGASGRFVVVPELADDAVRLPFVAAIAGLLLAAGLLGAAALRGSTLGRAWRAVRDNEPLARAFGCDPELLRLAAFVLSGLYCGAAGVLFSWLTEYVSPDSFNIWLSIYLLAIVIIGGRDELYGPLVGAALVVVVGELLRITGDLQAIVFGVVLLLVAVFLPQGIVRSLAEQIRLRRRARARGLARAWADPVAPQQAAEGLPRGERP